MGCSIIELYEKEIISKKLWRILSSFKCSTLADMEDMARNPSMLNYLDRRHNLKHEFLAAIDYIHNELGEKVVKCEPIDAGTNDIQSYVPTYLQTKFNVCDFTEHLLLSSENPLKLDDILSVIKQYLPNTYIESIRANLGGDEQERFIFFLDGYVGLNDKQYDEHYQICTNANRKRQYAETRIIEFITFIKEKHRSPQPHGLEEEESLYRWSLYFMKNSSIELEDLKVKFQNLLKEYNQWIYSPYEYSYKRNCEQFKWYVDKNVEMPSVEDEPELFSWFNFQLDYHKKYRDKRKQMFSDLLEYLSDYGIRFYDAKSQEGKEALLENSRQLLPVDKTETTLDRYNRVFQQIEFDECSSQECLLLLTMCNLLSDQNFISNIVILNDELLTEFADICIDYLGTASSCNITIPFCSLNHQVFWSLIPNEGFSYEDVENLNKPSYELLERIVYGVMIEQELVDLLSDNASLQKLKETLSSIILNS